MKRLALAAILAVGILNATDFSQMTTEELVAARGTVATEEREAFRDEMQSRVSTMTTEQKETLGISPKGHGDMTGSAPQDGTGLGNTGESTGGGMGFGGMGSSGMGSSGMGSSGMGGMGSGGGHGGGHGGGRR